MYPVLFHIGSFPIAPYGILTAAGLLAAIWFALPRARSVGVDDERMIDLLILSIIGGIIGAKLLYIANELDQLKRDWVGVVFSRAGLVYYGGLLAGMAVAIWCVRRKRLPLWPLADAIAPSIPLAHAFGRLGCFFSGCCYGRVCSPDNPIAISFPQRLGMPIPPALWDHIENTGLQVQYPHLHEWYPELPAGAWNLADTATRSFHVLPTQLIEMLLNLALAGGLLLLWRRRKFDGQVFLAYFLVYGVMRYGVELLRGDADRGVFFGGIISTSQLISVAILATALVMWFDVLELRTKLAAAMPGAPPEEKPDNSRSEKSRRKKKKRKTVSSKQ